MILYGLEHLKNGGVNEIGIILGPIREGIEETIGDGSKFNVHVTYIEQPEPKGLAHAVMTAEKFLNNSPFVMYLGDNLLKEGTQRFVGIYNSRKADCVLGVTPVKNTSQFGIAELKDGKVIRVIEKGRELRSNLALIGVYVFGSSIFDAIKTLKPSHRGEYEITDAIQILIEQGKKVEVETVRGWWKDTGRPEDLLEANQLVLSDIAYDVQIDLPPEASLTGSISIGKGTRVLGSVSLRGPIIVGENCTIGPNVHIGPYSSIGDNCMLLNTEIENSILMKDITIDGAKRIINSVIGPNSKISSGEAGLPKGTQLIIGERSVAKI